MSPKTPQALRPEPGRYLAASPRLLDPNFMHTVVLLCAHGDEGTFGLVLTRPTQFTVDQLSASLDLFEGRTDRLWGGGPVSTQELHVLHRGRGVPGAVDVSEELALDGDPAVIHAATKNGGAPAVRFFAGYAGWGAEQLSMELAEGSWIVCEAPPETAFDLRTESLWRRVLKSQGGPTAALADLPPDPSWN